MKNQQTVTDSIMLAPSASATTARTANLDTADANYATIRVALSAEANTNSTNVTLTLSESDDTVVTNFATFDSTFNRVVDNTTAVVATNHIDLDGRKRYLRLAITPDTTTNGAILSSAVASLQKTVMDSEASTYGDDVAIG